VPIPKIEVTRTRCQSCGERCGCPDEDAKCHGCSLIICGDCCGDYGHSFDGPHGLQNPLKFAKERAEGLRERDRRWSLPGERPEWL
jgi:hypothetical protein